MNKNKFNPNIHNRRSIRLKGYDYSQAGFYFITLCTQNHEHLFGEINDGKMVLNEAGNMLEKWYYELENKFTDIICCEMVVMPNHMHYIIQNVGGDLCAYPKNVGADLCVCPEIGNLDNTKINPNRKIKRANTQVGPYKNTAFGEHIGSP